MSIPAPAYHSGGLLIPVAPTIKSFATRLRESLREFEAQLSDTENFRIVAMMGGRAYAVEHIAVRGSELVVIDGPAEEPNRYRLLCHVSSLQLMLQVEPKQPHEKRRRIGFLWVEPEPDPEAAPAEGAAGGTTPAGGAAADSAAGGATAAGDAATDGTAVVATVDPPPTTA
jgi:hypothetical protein